MYHLIIMSRHPNFSLFVSFYLPISVWLCVWTGMYCCDRLSGRLSVSLIHYIWLSHSLIISFILRPSILLSIDNSLHLLLSRRLVSSRLVSYSFFRAVSVSLMSLHSWQNILRLSVMLPKRTGRNQRNKTTVVYMRVGYLLWHAIDRKWSGIIWRSSIKRKGYDRQYDHTKECSLTKMCNNTNSSYLRCEISKFSVNIVTITKHSLWHLAYSTIMRPYCTLPGEPPRKRIRFPWWMNTP